MQTFCDGRQNGTQCYGALGGNVSLRLLDKTDAGRYYTWTQNNALTILRVKKNRAVITDRGHDGRSSFDVSSGTFKMSDITRSDAGHYVLTVIDASTGQAIESENKHLHLSVQGSDTNNN